MKRLKFILMSVFAMLAMTTVFTSCTKDIIEDIMGKDEYYIVLDNVDTNIIDKEGNLLSQTIYDNFKFDKGGKSQSLGKADAAPLEVFKKSCKNIESSLQSAWNGNIPQNGYITYNFSLRKGAPNGDVQMKESVTVR